MPDFLAWVLFLGVVGLLAVGYLFYRVSRDRRRTATTPPGQPIAAPGAAEARRQANSLVLRLTSDIETATTDADFLELTDADAGVRLRAAIGDAQRELDQLAVALNRTASIDFTVNGPTATAAATAVRRAYLEADRARAALAAVRGIGR